MANVNVDVLLYFDIPKSSASSQYKDLSKSITAQGSAMASKVIVQAELCSENRNA